MAQFIFENASLKIFFETGVNEEGKPICTSKTFQNVRESASANQILAVVQAIESLSKDPVANAKIVKVNAVEV